MRLEKEFEGLSDNEIDALIEKRFQRTVELTKALAAFVREDRELPITPFSQSGLVGLWEDAGGVL